MYESELSVSYLALAQAPFLGEACASSMAAVHRDFSVYRHRWDKGECRFWKAKLGTGTLMVPRVPREFPEAANLFFKWEEYTWESRHLTLVDLSHWRNLVRRAVPSINVPHIMRTFPDFFLSCFEFKGKEEGSSVATWRVEWIIDTGTSPGLKPVPHIEANQVQRGTSQLREDTIKWYLRPASEKQRGGLITNASEWHLNKIKNRKETESLRQSTNKCLSRIRSERTICLNSFYMLWRGRDTKQRQDSARPYIVAWHGTRSCGEMDNFTVTDRREILASHLLRREVEELKRQAINSTPITRQCFQNPRGTINSSQF